jgi:hypothetical protein
MRNHAYFVILQISAQINMKNHVRNSASELIKGIAGQRSKFLLTALGKWGIRSGFMVIFLREKGPHPPL